MTPNWDDPAVAAGDNPTLESDRYSLALIFLRVVGAANFPIQARQRQGGPITVDFAVPAGHFGEALLGPGAPLWDLCERGLSVSDPACRPPGRGVVGRPRGGPRRPGRGWPSCARCGPPRAAGPRPPRCGLEPLGSPRDVIIRPVLAQPRPAPRRTLVPLARAGPPVAPGPAGAARRPGWRLGDRDRRPGNRPGPGGWRSARPPVATGPGPAGAATAGVAAVAGHPGPVAPPSDPAVTAQAGPTWPRPAPGGRSCTGSMLRALWTSGHRARAPAGWRSASSWTWPWPWSGCSWSP